MLCKIGLDGSIGKIYLRDLLAGLIGVCATIAGDHCFILVNSVKFYFLMTPPKIILLIIN